MTILHPHISPFQALQLVDSDEDKDRSRQRKLVFLVQLDFHICDTKTQNIANIGMAGICDQSPQPYYFNNQMANQFVVVIFQTII